MRAVTYPDQVPVGRVTPGLREAALIEYVGNDAALSQFFVQAMLEAGFVIRDVAQPSGQADALILAHGLAGDAFDSHWGAVEALGLQARRFEARGGTLILIQDTGGRFQPTDHRAWRGGLAGLARTAAREFPKATVRAIDLDVAGLGVRTAADRLVEELLSGCTAPCTGLSASGRVAPADAPFFLPASRPGLVGPGDVLLVTGGARGVTADCIIELARRTGARFALLGRSAITPWPEDLETTADERDLRGALAARARASGEKASPAALNREARALLSGAEIRQTLNAIEEAGGKALYIPSDVSKPADLRAALDQISETLGPVSGLVHGAGILADKMIREKTKDQVARVFAPKIAGLEALLSEIDTTTLKTISFFSSVAARYGNAGQADYAMANEILNRMAHTLKANHPGANIVSLGWGPWDGGMVDDSLKAKFAELGISLIPRAAGANLFADAVLAGAACPVELVIGSEIAHG